jgi:hypothetical protein
MRNTNQKSNLNLSLAVGFRQFRSLLETCFPPTVVQPQLDIRYLMS